MGFQVESHTINTVGDNYSDQKYLSCPLNLDFFHHIIYQFTTIVLYKIILVIIYIKLPTRWCLYQVFRLGVSKST
jgi:hypothetical protein